MESVQDHDEDDSNTPNIVESTNSPKMVTMQKFDEESGLGPHPPKLAVQYCHKEAEVVDWAEQP